MKVRIDVRGSLARLQVHGNEQPTLIVNDVKWGRTGREPSALWLDTETVTKFRI